jgi:DNA-binding NarL/FixJ family response regulator
MHAEPQVARAALDGGASGYLLKESAGEELMIAIREVLKNHIYVSPSITEDLLATIKQSNRRTDNHLTPRQRQVLRLVAEGRSMKEIASILKISARTVETYKYEMMRSLGCKTTADLIRFAIRTN